MKQLPLVRWFVNVSIARKLYFAIGIMAVLIVLELLTLWFSIHTLSSVRASVGAEGIWSKAQKDAVYALHKYALSGDRADYAEFRSQLKIHLGDQKAFAELRKEKPDREIMRQGYIQGGIHPDDADGTANLFLRFSNISYIKEALDLFYRSESMMDDLQAYADQLRAIVSVSGNASPEKTAPILDKIEELNVTFTRLESKFSATLGEGARWLENLVLKVVFAIALTVEISGILLAVSVSRGISRGVRDIIRTSEQLAGGNFGSRATIYSKDEIGQLASSFNNMIDEVTERNNELEQFAYAASHDLQEPLRTISNFVGLLERKNTERTAEETEHYMGYISKATSTMQALIKDLLDISRIGKAIEFTSVDCNAVLAAITYEMEAKIDESDVTITSSELPVLTGNETELNQLFRNLISNAIKFRRKNAPAKIEIGATECDDDYIFSFADNGIGIEDQYRDRIFIIFQRLHSTSEYQGTGIGLAICKKIADTHGGRIWVESVFGEGSTFYFTLSKSLTRRANAA